MTSLKVDQFETIWKLRFEPPNWSDASEKNPNGLLKALVNLKGESLKVTGLKANSSVEFSVNQLRALILQQVIHLRNTFLCFCLIQFDIFFFFGGPSDLGIRFEFSGNRSS